jgi:phosphoribulokinase
VERSAGGHRSALLRRSAWRRQTETIDVGRHVDLCVGVVPIINLEWIQKLHRDKAQRGYSTEAVMDTILRRMPDYINYICPQFSTTHVNFQRVPTVDTSNPFMPRTFHWPTRACW